MEQQQKHPSKAQIDMKLNGRVISIFVKNTDNAEVVAREFIAQNNLSTQLQIPLSQKIQQTINKLHPMTESSVVKSILKQSHFSQIANQSPQQKYRVKTTSPMQEKHCQQQFTKYNQQITENKYIYRVPRKTETQDSVKLQNCSNLEQNSVEPKSISEIVQDLQQKDNAEVYDRLYNYSKKPSKIPDLRLDDLTQRPIVTDGKVFDRLFNASKQKVVPFQENPDFKKVQYTKKDIVQQTDAMQKLSKPVNPREKSTAKPKEPEDPLKEAEQIITEKEGPLIMPKLGMGEASKRMVEDMGYNFQDKLQYDVEKRNTKQHQLILNTTLDTKLVQRLTRNLSGEKKIQYLEQCKQRQLERLAELDGKFTRNSEEEVQLLKLKKELGEDSFEKVTYQVQVGRSKFQAGKPHETTEKILVKKINPKTNREIYQYQEQKFNYQPMQFAKNEGYYQSYLNKRDQQTADDIIFAAVNGTRKNYDLKDNGFTFRPDVQGTRRNYNDEILNQLLYIE